MISFPLPTCNQQCDLWPNSTCSPAVFKRSDSCDFPLRGACLWHWDAKLTATTDWQWDKCVSEVWFGGNSQVVKLLLFFQTKLHCSRSSYRFQETRSRWIENPENCSASSVCSVVCVQAACCLLQLSSDCFIRLWKTHGAASVLWLTVLFCFSVRIRTTRGQQNDPYNLSNFNPEAELKQPVTPGDWMNVLFWSFLKKGS